MTETVANVGLPAGELVPAGDHQLFVIDVGSGDGTPVVMLQGGGPGCSGWTDFAPVLPYFEDRRVVMIDLLGYGQSEKPAMEGPVWTNHAAHVAMAMTSLGLDGCDIVCSSIGGSTALALAANHPEKVHKLVVTGCEPLLDGPRVPPPGQEGIGFAAVQDYYLGEDGPTREKCRDIMATLEWFDESAIPESTVDLRFAQSVLPDHFGMDGDFSRNGDPEDLAEKLPTITAPVLFLWGMQDPFAVPEYALRLARAVPYGEVHVLDKASHHFEEERPGTYSSLVREFLDRPVDQFA